MDPVNLGLDANLLRVMQADVREILITHYAMFSYVSRGEYDEHNVFLHPCLHDIHRRTQTAVLIKNPELRDWMERFAVRKLLVTHFGRKVLYGENRVKWGNHAQPRALPAYTSEIPNFNQLSVAYASSFCVPECMLSSIDLTQLTQTMQTNVIRAEPLTELIIAPENERNYEDFRRILLALVFPGQVMIDVLYEKDVNVYLAGFISLCSKLRFSTTPGFQNITRDSALAAEVRLGHMLEDIGYNTHAGEPLNVDGRIPNAVLWNE